MVCMQALQAQEVILQLTVNALQLHHSLALTEVWYAICVAAAHILWNLPLRLLFLTDAAGPVVVHC